MAAKNGEWQLERAAGKEGEHANPATAGRAHSSPRRVCSALNRLIVAGWSEIAALEAAERSVDGAERRSALREQVRRRVIFRHDLAAAVGALGGVPAEHATVAARVGAPAHRLRELAIGPHSGDAYAVCARATEAAAKAYAKALTLELPADVMFGVERQASEIEWDRRELRRLRWGAELTPPPDRNLDEPGKQRQERPAREVDDERAVGVWNNEGGGASGRSTSLEGRAGLARALD